MALSLGALGPRVAVCPRPVAAMDCCAGEDDDGPRLERACCCLEVPDTKHSRPADVTGLRPPNDPDVELARPAGAGDVPQPVVRRFLPPPRPISRPPPTLLEARTSFRC